MTMAEFCKLDLAEGKNFLVKYREKFFGDKWAEGNILFLWDFELWNHVWEWDLDEGQEIEILYWLPIDNITFYTRDDGTIENEYLINKRI